jgi:ribosome modulation factor
VKITELPVCVDPNLEASRRRAWDIAHKEGENACAAGLRSDDCLPFTDKDLAIMWKMGWRHEDERRKAEKRNE